MNILIRDRWVNTTKPACGHQIYTTKLGYKLQRYTYHAQIATLNVLARITRHLKCIQQPADNFDITQYIKFATNNASSRLNFSIRPNKLVHNVSHYNTIPPVNSIVRLWNALPTINLDLSISSSKIFISN